MSRENLLLNNCTGCLSRAGKVATFAVLRCSFIAFFVKISDKLGLRAVSVNNYSNGYVRPPSRLAPTPGSSIQTLGLNFNELYELEHELENFNTQA